MSKMPTVAEAEADLQAHEKFIQAVHRANWERCDAEAEAAKGKGTAQDQKAAHSKHEAAILDHIAANDAFLAHSNKMHTIPDPTNSTGTVTVSYARAVDVLAQRVLDAREREIKEQAAGKFEQQLITKADVGELPADIAKGGA